jgi:CcmD family protein
MIFLVAGMMVFWLATFFFVWSISRRQHKLEEELGVLREVVADGTAGQA